MARAKGSPCFAIDRGSIGLSIDNPHTLSKAMMHASLFLESMLSKAGIIKHVSGDIYFSRRTGAEGPREAGR